MAVENENILCDFPPKADAPIGVKLSTFVTSTPYTVLNADLSLFLP